MKKVNWKRLIPGCFAGQTAAFGIHPLDGDRAEKMFHAAMRAGASMEDIFREARLYLKSRGVSDDGIEDEINRMKKFKRNPMKKKALKSAWLITREGANAGGEVVAIFNYRKSGEQVRQFMENLYIAEEYSLHEKLTYARNRKNNPHPATFETIQGVPWEGRITCGHNPWLYGRKVRNLNLAKSDSRNQKLVWEEIPSPKNLK